LTRVGCGTPEIPSPSTGCVTGGTGALLEETATVYVVGSTIAAAFEAKQTWAL